MSDRDFGLLKTSEAPAPWGRVWWLTAGWAHPFWHSYMVMLVDLTTPAEEPPVIYMPTATHEVVVFALNPDHPAQTWPPHRLEPANHGYQFKAASNEDAEARVLDLIESIRAKKLSPDTDFRAVWDALFIDGVSLRASSLTAPAGTVVQ